MDMAIPGCPPWIITITLPMAPLEAPGTAGTACQNTRYNAENIMVLSYNKDGTIDWSGIIPKNQYDDESDNMISFQLVNTGTDIHFLLICLKKRPSC